MCASPPNFLSTPTFFLPLRKIEIYESLLKSHINLIIFFIKHGNNYLTKYKLFTQRQLEKCTHLESVEPNSRQYLFHPLPKRNSNSHYIFFRESHFKLFSKLGFVQVLAQFFDAVYLFFSFQLQRHILKFKFIYLVYNKPSRARVATLTFEWCHSIFLAVHEKNDFWN